MSTFRGWDHIDRLEKENAMLRAENEALKADKQRLEVAIEEACSHLEGRPLYLILRRLEGKEGDQ